MWLSKQMTRKRIDKLNGTVGVVSVGGFHPAVVTDTERRQLRLCTCGGYGWKPTGQDDVLVVDETVVGSLTPCPVDIAAGEVYIYSRGGSVYLKNNGDVMISGSLYLNGVEITGESGGDLGGT